MSLSPASPARSRIGTTYVDQHDDTPAAIIAPQGLGDGRPDRDDTPIIDRFLDTVDDFLSVGEEIREIRNLITETLARALWVSSAQLNNTTGTTGTFAGVQYAFGIGFSASLGYSVQLRHIQVGSDTAGAIFLFATRGSSPDPMAGGLRMLGVVRVTATNPTGYSNLQPILDDGENLVVALAAASGKLDFACEYRAMRAGN